MALLTEKGFWMLQVWVPQKPEGVKTEEAKPGEWMMLNGGTDTPRRKAGAQAQFKTSKKKTSIASSLKGSCDTPRSKGTGQDSQH